MTEITYPPVSKAPYTDYTPGLYPKSAATPVTENQILWDDSTAILWDDSTTILWDSA